MIISLNKNKDMAEPIESKNDADPKKPTPEEQMVINKTLRHENLTPEEEKIFENWFDRTAEDNEEKSGNKKKKK